METGEENVVCVTLSRKTSDQPWGFRMVGGQDQESCLHIAKVNPRSLAARCGLRAGDAVLMIEQLPATSIHHDRAKAEILRAGNDLRLVVKREAVRVKEEPQDMRRSMVLEEVTEYRGDPNPSTQSRTFYMLSQFLEDELNALEAEKGKPATVNGPTVGSVFGGSQREAPKTQISGSAGGSSKGSGEGAVKDTTSKSAAVTQSASKSAAAPASKPATTQASKPATTQASKPATTQASKPATTLASKPAETKTTVAPADKTESKVADSKTAATPAKPAAATPAKPAAATPAKPAESPADKPASKPAESPARKASQSPAKSAGGTKDSSPATRSGRADESTGPESDYSDGPGSESSEGTTFTLTLNL